MDLARMAVQSERVAWGKRLLDQAAKVRAAKEGPA
jgi:hypothetical protein